MIYVPGCRQAAADMMSRRRRKLPASLHMLQVNELQEPTMDDDKMEQFVVRLNSVQADINAVELNSLDMKFQVITWEQVLQATGSDNQMQKLVEQIQRGFPDSQYDLPADIKEFQKFRHGLSVVDGVVCYKHRIVVPKSLRSMVLDTLHSAHQGVSGMISRADQSVFWPGITLDIQKKRDNCLTCTRNAPSQPMTKPVDPPSPEYPFQMLVGDYCSLYGINYLVVADRYSGWFSVYQCGKGTYDADALIDVLKGHFGCFGVCTEFSNDFGPQFASLKFSKFLQQYGVKHRISSSYNPHSNTRAELAVKSAKRLMRDCVKADGSFDDRFYQGVLQYRNTPQQDVRLSPAQIVFGRQIKDFIPVVGNKYEPQQE